MGMVSRGSHFPTATALVNSPGFGIPGAVPNFQRATFRALGVRWLASLFLGCIDWPDRKGMLASSGRGRSALGQLG